MLRASFYFLFLLTLQFANGQVATGHCEVQEVKCLSDMKNGDLCLKIDFNDGEEEASDQILLTSRDNSCVYEGSFQNDRSIYAAASATDCPRSEHSNIEVSTLQIK